MFHVNMKIFTFQPKYLIVKTEQENMQEPTVTAIQAIQAILAPAIGISAVGLLLLGLTNRYSNIVTRIRLMNEEKRRYTQQLADEGELNYTDNVRLMSIGKQTEGLLVRSRYVRNAILSLQISIGLFVLSSVSIAVNLFATTELLQAIPLFVFIVGMVTLFIGVVYSAREIHYSYHIVLLEVRGEE